MSSSTDPSIVNRRPDEGDTDVTADTPFRFGVRDVNTRADLSSVYAAVLYSQVSYRPDEDLPLQDEALESAQLVFSNFDDAAGAVEPGNPCDQTLEAVGDASTYRIEKSDVDGTEQEGVLFISADAAGVRPYGASAQIDLAFVDTWDRDYLDFSDFVGVLMGLVYWPENTGVFLFFKDDGTKRVTVVGPSEDGAGTRSVSQTTDFDWSAEAYTYTIVLDPTVYRRKVIVFATDSEGVETLLAELSLDSFNEFLPAVRMGRLFAESSPDKVTMLVGLDAPDMGNYIEVSHFDLFGYGAVLVTSGGPTGSSGVTITPVESHLTVGAAGLDDWSSSGGGEGVLELRTNSAVLTTVEGDAFYKRDEPDFCGKEWLVLGKIAGQDAAHPGYYETGMAIEVADGTSSFQLHLLDNFAANVVGIPNADAAEDEVLVGYLIDETGHDWETAFEFVWMGSDTRDEIRLEIDGVQAVSHDYSSAYPSTTDARIRLGFLETEGVYSGTFFLFYLWFFPNCTFYEARDLDYPDDQGWSRESSGGTRDASAGVLDLGCAAAGAYDIYYIEDATYDPTSGAAVIFEMSLVAWTDASEAASPPRSEIGPVAAVRTTTVAAQLYFVQSLDGTVYLYLPHDDDDVAYVLAQNAQGRAMSVEVDPEETHTYLLVVKPFHHIRVYLDMEPEPVIEVAWQDSGSGLRALPTNMPADAVVAVGSLGEDGGVQAQFSNFRASIGRGYDVSARPSLAESEMQERVYGSVATLVIDAQDED